MLSDLGGTHRAIKLRSDREGARKGRSRAVVVGLAHFVLRPCAVTLGIRLRRFVKKKKNANRLCCRRRWPRNFERSWPDLTKSQTSQTPDSGGTFEHVMHDINKLCMSAHTTAKAKLTKEKCSDCLRWSPSCHRRVTGCSTPRKRIGNAQVDN